MSHRLVEGKESALKLAFHDADTDTDIYLRRRPREDRVDNVVVSFSLPHK